MDPQVSTSFIPKKSLENRPRSKTQATGLLLLVAILIFVASLVAAGGVFAYQGLLNQSLASKSASLSLNEKAYDPGVIQELTRVDSRINEARGLLEAHVAPSAIFAFLSMQTLEKVQFTNFDYQMSPDGKIEIKMRGIADSFSTVALQSDQFGASKVLRDVVFSGVDIGELGKVDFNVSATVVPSLTLYSNVITTSPTTPLEEEVPADSTQ